MLNDSRLNKSTVDMDNSEIINILNYIFYALLLLLGVPGNILVIWSLLSTRKEQVSRSYKSLVINLAVNDILMLLIICPFEIAQLSIEYYPFGRVMCSLLWPLQTACTGAGVFNMVALNVHRFYVISYPTSSRSLEKITIVAVVLCWVIPALITALPYAIHLDYKVKPKISCHEIWSNNTANGYTIYLFAVQYILPLLIIATLNLLTIRRLRRRYMFRSNCARLTKDNLHAHRRIVKMLIFIILIFALFGLPVQIIWLIPVVSSDTGENSEYLSVRSLADIFNFMYCVLNPVIFFAYNNECHDKLRKYFSSVFACCGYHWEVKSPTGTRREANTTLLPASRISDSQDTSHSDASRYDPRYAPAIPKFLLQKKQENSKRTSLPIESKPQERSISAGLYSAFTGLYTPAISFPSGNVDHSARGSTQVLKVADDKEIFRSSFVELLRTRNVTNDLMKHLDASPETALVEEGSC